MSSGRQMQRTIQVARRKLGLDDETYRQFLYGLTGKRSTKDMDGKELWFVVQHLKKSGFEMEQPKGDISQAGDPQSTLIRHLWLKLKNYGILRDSSERALTKYVKRIAKVDSMRWLTSEKAQLVIETLKNWIERIELKLINEAIQQGLLTVPFGLATYAEFCACSILSMTEDQREQAIEFKNAVESYLYTYKPKTRPAKEKKVAV